jgi:hypothetical protein
VSLSKGNRATVSVHYGFHMRALCVRQPAPINNLPRE